MKHWGLKNRVKFKIISSMFKKINPQKPTWLIFIIGLIFGILIFAVYNYFAQKNNYTEKSESTIPISFDIKDYDHSFGNPNSKNKIIVFNDLNCPYCRDYTNNLYELSQDPDLDAQVVWRHFPLDQTGPESMPAAIASECADEQGKFWDFIFSLRDYPERELKTYLDIADSLNLDEDQFSACLKSDRFTAKIKADYYEGIMKGVIGAPASFINGEYIPGVIPLVKLKELISNQ